MSRALVLTYHAIEEREGPLFVDPETFAVHLDCIAEADADAVTVSELVAALRSRRRRRPAIAVTFDDGFASVVRTAAPLLAERGIPATVYCVAGHLGRLNDWPSALRGSPLLELADARELAELAAAGFEIGCHGMTHAPLRGAKEESVEQELVEAREVLQREVRADVRSFAYPYGAAPSPDARRVVARTYESACTTTLGYVTHGADEYALPRVDAHYVRRPRLLRSALAGSLGPYLLARRLGAGARRGLRRDYSVTGTRS